VTTDEVKLSLFLTKSSTCLESAKNNSYPLRYTIPFNSLAISTTNMAALLQPVTVGSGSAKLPFRNRIIMSALTRNRCIDNFKPGPAQVKHYADRARHSTGLIVSEGVFVDWTGSEWPCTPVMVTDDHATAWRKVTDAVHAEGGLMLMQAWHAGRSMETNSSHNSPSCRPGR